MFFKNLCALVLWTKVASALEGLKWGSEMVSSVEIAYLIKALGRNEAKDYWFHGLNVPKPRFWYEECTDNMAPSLT